MTKELILAFAAFALITSITPGPNNLMLMASGTNFGLRRTLPHMLGVTLGLMLMVALVGLGIARVFQIVPYSYLVLKCASALYLLYLAWKIATTAPPDGTLPPEHGKPFTFLQAAAFQWVNPKAWAMALTAVSAYTIPAEPFTSLMVVVLVFWLINMPCVSLWTALGTQVRRLLNNPVRLRVFNLTAALLLVTTLWPILTSAGVGAH